MSVLLVSQDVCWHKYGSRVKKIARIPKDAVFQETNKSVLSSSKDIKATDKDYIGRSKNYQG